MKKPESNRYVGRELNGKRVVLCDGRQGLVTHGGYGLVSIDLDEGHWYCGPVDDVNMELQPCY